MKQRYRTNLGPVFVDEKEVAAVHCLGRGVTKMDADYVFIQLILKSGHAMVLKFHRTELNNAVSIVSSLCHPNYVGLDDIDYGATRD